LLENFQRTAAGVLFLGERMPIRIFELEEPNDKQVRGGTGKAEDGVPGGSESDDQTGGENEAGDEAGDEAGAKAGSKI
jgi:hypothetical protein